jgi:hypothetical protein
MLPRIEMLSPVLYLARLDAQEVRNVSANRDSLLRLALLCAIRCRLQVEEFLPVRPE